MSEKGDVLSPLVNCEAASISLSVLLLSSPMFSALSTALQGLFTLVVMSVAVTGSFFSLLFVLKKRFLIDHSPQTAEAGWKQLVHVAGSLHYCLVPHHGCHCDKRLPHF